jgi:DNA polymerase V
MTEKFDDLEQYVRGFASSCAASLRHQKSVCNAVTVFLSTNRHRDDLEQYRNSSTMKLTSPTADTPTLIKASLLALKQLFREGFLYKQAGVILSDICEEQGMQLDLFTEPNDERHRKLMHVADQLNRKYGDNTVSFL